MATLATAEQFFDFADRLALVSTQVLIFRLRNRATSTEEERQELERIEGELDRATAEARAKGIEEIAAAIQNDREEIEQACVDAEALLKRIRKAERAIGIALAVLGLAAAVTSNNPTAIVAATKNLQKTFKA